MVKNKSVPQPFHSPYVLKTFATHLKVIQGTLCDGDGPYPIGALAMSVITVQFAFKMYATGIFVASKGFSNETAGPLVRKYSRGNDFARLVEKNHRFDKIIESALVHVFAPKKKHQERNVRLEVIPLTILSSPPGSPMRE
ncbi:hypothetical protein HYDPIDRAFT_25112 [Hydnomerulius pinastri MD-312]|nr:hypothetical protein HYDPIDRAFT_25112 [Hydnomerulius pinastri MD-312]